METTKDIGARHDDGGRFEWNPEQERIIREQFADGCTDDELAVLLYQAKRRRLDPFLGHIRGIKRWNSAKGREVMAVQTSIDAFRLIAERTGRYGGGPAPEFRTAKRSNGEPDVIARTTVRKQTRDGTWHDVSDEARWSEYVQTNRQGQAAPMWVKMPTTMLAKCAEAKTLRKAFPEELGGLYTDDEMAQADNPAAEDSGGGGAGQAATSERRPSSGSHPAQEGIGEAAVVNEAQAKPEPVTHFYEPDEWQERRFVAAMNEAKDMPGLKDEIIRSWGKAAATCKSSDGYNTLLDEMEAAVGLTEQASTKED